jgi:hypothetical protein
MLGRAGIGYRLPLIRRTGCSSVARHKFRARAQCPPGFTLERRPSLKNACAGPRTTRLRARPYKTNCNPAEQSTSGCQFFFVQQGSPGTVDMAGLNESTGDCLALNEATRSATSFAGCARVTPRRRRSSSIATSLRCELTWRYKPVPARSLSTSLRRVAKSDRSAPGARPLRTPRPGTRATRD